jgi:YD repeat-containing protein
VRIGLFLLLLFINPLEGHVQILLNQEGEAFTDIPFFNSDVIRANHIKSMEGNYSTKKSGEVILETTDCFRYRFDENGQLIESLDIRTKNRKKDTTLHQYQYNSLHQLIAHRKTENGGFTTLKPRYDSLNRLESERTFREIYHYQKDQVLQSNLVNTEYFQHLFRTNEHEVVRYNSYKLPYLNEVRYYNKDGYLSEEKINYRMSSIEHTTKYYYNDRGLLESKSHYNEKDELADEEWKYRYDNFGNLIEVHYFRYGQLQKDLQVVFDTKTQLLGSTIQRDVVTNSLLILRFTKFTYYQ